MFPEASPDEDVNIKLFKIYQWVMVKDASSLELVSALSMVESYLITECMFGEDESDYRSKNERN